MIYLDSAALVKLIRTERETPGLITWLNERSSEHLVASALVEVEVPRALRRSAPGVLGSAAGVLARLYRMEINAAVRATAGAYPDSLLRSLDAVHLATAQLLIASGQEISAFVTYDKRLAAVAESAGLTVVAPE
ncbi:putative nucleic acid-binding protein [Catenuloplanes nepalensis]|uniref:Nucleic acid-binding protein n=1 Tax=Catenuloplanes nepalensis TaxID=587533 RepID=A0ABT9MK55_9ACTN|nr:type II toxin-antitoxin system VapC family toxin [Catenuloplanes nepalensis]MDP9791798.1 putative nucleic acid-binding protein [Catenuloplanes nepalensis]